MFINFTAKYTKIPSGYLGQLIEWPEVLTEGRPAALLDPRSQAPAR